MDTSRTADRPGEEAPIGVLLAGPDQWRARLEPAFAAEGFSTRAADTADGATTAVTQHRDRVDCVVAAERLDDATGLDLLADLRTGPDPPAFVLAPSDGGESLAGRAVGADVEGYVPAHADAETLRRRCRAAVERRRDRRRLDRAATGFEAVFASPDRFAVVLDTDGTVVRANDVACRSFGVEESTAIGTRFWGLPWADAGRTDLQRAVRRAREGEYVDFEARLPGGEEGVRFEFSVDPVGDDTVDRLFVEGRKIAERARLEEELRESEELHRVTLNNMTDTVLVTDDDGEFTYVCPNVHFIFGYSAEEIYDLGTIDALLGEDLFDRARLDAEGVLTNIECTATDKRGREHTLLVNVRRVSIQDGTVLYSCRDVTKRKQRERALTQLHRTSRDLLYAETGPEIADSVVSDAPRVLPSSAAAVYQFDSEENVLYPTAASDGLESAFGALPEVRPDRTTAVGRAFVEGETRRADTSETLRSDADENYRSDAPDPSSREQSPLASLGDYVAIPLSDHGVFLATTTDGDAFDEVGGDVMELLAATAEAAFDRVERESELRDRDRRLQRQNERLSKLNRVNEFIREIDRALVGAESREHIETAVCERLTEDDRFAFAWIGETSPVGRTLRPRTWAGDDRGYLDSVPLEVDAGAGSHDSGDAPAVEPSLRAADDRETAFVPNVAEGLRTGNWCKEAVARDFQSVLSIPLAYDDVLFGTLTIYAASADAFDDMIRSVLTELGDTVASAINAVQRKEALRSDAVVELEYDVPDSNATLARLASASGATLDVEGTVARDDGTTLVFAAVEDGDPDRVLDAAEGFVGVTDVRSFGQADGGGLVGIGVEGAFVSAVLADHGSVLRRLRATPDGLSLSVDVPDSVPTRTIDEVITNRYDAADPVAKRERDRALDATSRRGRFRDDLTDRQLEVAQVAYHAGFFDSSRDVTGRDVASMLDISDTAFYDHVRRIQRKLFASLFEPGPEHVDLATSERVDLASREHGDVE